jgi:hypothetical protein
VVSNLATKEDFNNLLTAVDAYAKKADMYFREMGFLSRNKDAIFPQKDHNSGKL